MKTKKEKIKLVQIIADADLSGGPKHVMELLANIDKSLFDCYLICPLGNLSREIRDNTSVEVINIPMYSKFDLIAIYKIIKALQYIQAKHNPFGHMIVHTHGPRAGLLGRLAIPRGVYSVYTEHRWDENFHLENRFNEWLQLLWLKKMHRKTDLIIAVSESVKKIILKRKMVPEGRIRVIPNGISLARDKRQETITKHKRRGNHYIIGNIGNLNHHKGHIYLIEAMPQIIEHYPHAMLEIIGEGDERKTLESKIAELGLEKHITLLGRQLDPERFMKKWSVFVSSSIAESFGIVILEAYLQCLPVVATKVGGVSDIIVDGKNGVLIPRENPEAIAQAVVDLFMHPAKAEKISRAGFERAKDFDWKKIVKEIEREYEDLIR